MRQNKDWTEALQQRLQGAETAPPPKGWNRLAGALVPWWQQGRFWGMAAAAAVVAAVGVTWLFDGQELPIVATVIPSEITYVAEEELPEPQPWNEQPQKRPHTTLPVSVVEPPKEPLAESSILCQIEPGQPTDTLPETKPEKTSAKPSGKTTYRPLIQDDLVADNTPKKRGKTTLSIYGSGSFASSSKTVRYEMAEGNVSWGNLNNSYGTFDGELVTELQPQTAQQKSPYDYDHHLPWSIGVAVRKELRRGFSLTSGVVYTHLSSSCSMGAGRSVSQELHFIGVPLRVEKCCWEVERFRLYVGAGALLEYCVQASLADERVDENRLQAAVTLAAGGEYRIGRYTSFYLEPELSYHFTETKLETIRTDKPLMPTLRLGVRWTF